MIDKSGFRLVALIVAATLFMSNMDSVILNTSLPQVAASLGVRPIEMSAGITAYIVATAAFLPLSSWTADRYGARRVFAAAIAIFTLASVACAAAATLPQFITARIAQGAGASLMTPVGRALVLRNTGKRDLLDAIALITWPALLAPVVAPVLGGLITTYSSWRWNFLLNVPLGAIAMVLALRFIPQDDSIQRRSMDIPGLIYSSVALFCLLFSLESFAGGRVDPGPAVLLALCGVVAGFIAIRHFRRASEPLLDLSAFAVQTFRLTTGSAGLIFRATIAATPFLLPLLLQLGYGLTPLQAGGFITVYFLGNLLCKPATSPTLRRFGFRRVLIINGVLSGLTILACGFLAPLTAPLLAGAVLFVTGVTRSMQFTCLNTLGFADIEPAQRSPASTLYSMMLQISMGLGVATAALLLQKSLELRGHTSPEVIDFRVAFVVVGLLGVVSALIFTRLPRNAGAEVTGHGGD